jgi:hypothetical protein
MKPDIYPEFRATKPLHAEHEVVSFNTEGGERNANHVSTP